ncbi:helix-turn-helix domain-containing protein [Chitinophaga defluvii]|uniref:AraC family transcriptional regulator n=1 Tax=Chitinophaga defluvii TaxID=3163343 RepID=A0ABV2T1B4_9BACT
MMEFTLNENNILELASHYKVKDNVMHFDIPGGHVGFTEYKSNQFNVLQGRYEMETDCFIEDSTSGPSIEMQFNLSAPIEFSIYRQEEILAPAMHHNVINLCGERTTIALEGKKHYQTFDVHLSPAFLTRWYGQYALLDEFLDKANAQEPALLFKDYMPITPQMQVIMKEIVECDYNTFIRQLYIEAKVQELFALQLDLASCMKQIGKSQSMHAADKERIYAAKAYIEENLDTPCSIIALAHKVGTNDFKLKKGFKELFGSTVFAYMQQLRMTKAREYLNNSSLPLDEIAALTGYSNVANFTNAFKKHFNITPGSLRKG